MCRARPHIQISSCLQHICKVRQARQRLAMCVILHWFDKLEAINSFQSQSAVARIWTFLSKRLTGDARPRFFESYALLEEQVRRARSLPNVVRPCCREAAALRGARHAMRGCAAAAPRAPGGEMGHNVRQREAMTVGCKPTTKRLPVPCLMSHDHAAFAFGRTPTTRFIMGFIFTF